MTWVLLLFLFNGLAIPVDFLPVYGFGSKAECEQAGKLAMEMTNPDSLFGQEKHGAFRCAPQGPPLDPAKMKVER